VRPQDPNLRDTGGLPEHDSRRMGLPTGTRIRQYVVEGVLGEGGMAVVYVVRHEVLGTLAALKLLRRPSPAVARRLLLEGRAQSGLRHPNVVAVTDTVDLDGDLGLVMELIEGPTLEAVLATVPLSTDESDALGRGILDGVRAAHERGIVHRDLKPGNVLLASVGGELVPKIADFGLAKVLGDEEAGRTRTGTGLGTPPYMAPEQIRDAGRTDERADVFSLGAVLQELVTGKRAFDGPDVWEVFRAIQEGRPAPLPPEVPERMRAAIAGALVVDRDARTPSVAALAAAWCDGTPAPASPWSAALRAAAAATPGRPTSHPRDLGATFGSGFSSSATPTPSAAPPSGVPPNVVSPPASEPPPAPRAPPLAWALSFAVAGVGLAALGARALAPDAEPSPPPSFRQLTFASARLSSPSLSPSGDEVVYSVDGHLERRRVGSDRPFELGPGEAPALSPDGTRLALHRPDGVWVAAVDGSSPRRLTGAGGRPAWSPDGQLVAFVDCALDDPLTACASGDVGLVPAAGGAIRVVAPGAQARGVSFAPDGRHLVGWSDARELFVADLEGGAPVVLEGEGAAWAPVWVDDELWFLSDRTGGTNLWARPVTPDGRAAGPDRPLTRGSLGDVRSFAVAPDHRRVVYAAADVGSEVWTAPVTQDHVGPPTRVRQSAHRHDRVALADDGASYLDTPGWWDALAAPEGGGGLRRLTDLGSGAHAPALSPDGTTLAFLGRATGRLGTVRPDGSDLRDLGPVSALGLVWAPDGRSLVATGSPSVELALGGEPTGRRWAGEVRAWAAEGLLLADGAGTQLVGPDGDPKRAWPRRVDALLGAGRALAVDGSTLVVLGADGAETPLIDVSPARFGPRPVAAVSGDGRHLAFVAAHETANLWSVTLGAP
jgi:serine/threonine protein kinase/Tol biopolymer transport system component